jgi:uncharacterized protein
VDGSQAARAQDKRGSVTWATDIHLRYRLFKPRPVDARDTSAIDSTEHRGPAPIERRTSATGCTAHRQRGPAPIERRTRATGCTAHRQRGPAPIERRTSAIDSTAHRQRGPAPIERHTGATGSAAHRQRGPAPIKSRTRAIGSTTHRHRSASAINRDVAVLAGERDRWVVQIAGMSFQRKDNVMQGLTRTARSWLDLMRGVLVFAAVAVAGAHAEVIVTGGKTGTYFQIGNNLKEIVSPELEVRDSKGSWANVEDLSQTEGVGLAIVQSDVYAAFVYLRDSRQVPWETRRQYAKLLSNLRVFMPLYREEIHFLVKQDSPLEFIHQIRGKRIWMDAEKSGTYLTALNIYSKMFNERPTVVEPFINPTVTGDDEGTRTRRSALMVLSDPDFYKSLPQMDVLVLVGGQPLKLLEANVPTNLKLLKFDPTHSTAAKVLQDYKRADIQKSSYPSLNIADAASPSLGVDSYLITANFIRADRNKFITDFADQFCEKFDVLQSKGHPKWKSLSWKPGSPLPALAAGWQYSARVKDRLSRCGAQGSASAILGAAGAQPAATPAVCRPQDRFVGLCR